MKSDDIGKQRDARDTLIRRTLTAKPLAWLLLLAFALRVVAACQPGFHHPDAIYQYLEPAFRLVTGEGVVTWEWRIGMRSWLLPTLLTAPVALGEALDPHGPLTLVLPRIAMGIGSLGIVWAAWRHGQRHGDIAGWLAGFVAATWFELIYFGAQTLAEPLATAAFLAASVWVTEPRPSVRERFGSGVLIVVMVLLRPHYAPAGIVVLGFAWWPLLAAPRDLPGRLMPFFAGGVVMALIAAAIDLRSGAIPFAWIVANARQNLIEGVAARYGIAPPLEFVAWLLAVWQWWFVPLAIGVRFGWRFAPALVAAAALTILLHSLIGHKEYRFVFLSVASLLIVSAIGWAEIITGLRRRWPDARGRIAAPAVFACWGIASILLASGSLARHQRSGGVAGSRLFAALREDPKACGVAIVFRAAFADFPGQVGLGARVPLSMFWSNHTITRGVQSWTDVASHGGAFNRILASIPREGPLPVGYRPVRCEPVGRDAGICLYARPGGCRRDPDSPFSMNRMLAAQDA